MRLLCDADGLIKLHRAGVLANVVRAFTCTVPEPVFHELVTLGKAYLHQDAEEIEAVLAGTTEILPVPTRPPPESGLGSGEIAILGLVSREPGRIVVSDDRRFLSALTSRSIPFLTPADLVVVLARRGVLTRDEANDALERLRPVIRAAAYWEAREDLQLGDKDREE